MGQRGGDCDPQNGLKTSNEQSRFIAGPGHQRRGADAEFAQFGAGRQVGAYGFQIHIPAARQRLAPEQGFVELNQRAAPALEDGVNQVLRLGLEGGGPVGNAHGGVELDRIPLDAEGLTPQMQGLW